MKEMEKRGIQDKRKMREMKGRRKSKPHIAIA